MITFDEGRAHPRPCTMCTRTSGSFLIYNVPGYKMLTVDSSHPLCLLKSGVLQRVDDKVSLLKDDSCTTDSIRVHDIVANL